MKTTVRTINFAPHLSIHVQECIDDVSFGLFLWPSSLRLARFLYGKWRRDSQAFAGKRIIELGAG